MFSLLSTTASAQFGAQCFMENTMGVDAKSVTDLESISTDILGAAANDLENRALNAGSAIDFGVNLKTGRDASSLLYDDTVLTSNQITADHKIKGF